MHDLSFDQIFHLLFSGTPLPNKGRIQHSCAHIKHKNGSNYVIVVGGYDSKNDYLKTSDILTFEPKAHASDLKWSPGIVELIYLIGYINYAV